MDYLLKPIKFDRFLKAINRIIDLKKTVISTPSVIQPEISEKIEKTEKLNTNFIFIKDGTTNYKINFTDLLYIQAYGNFAKIHLLTQTLVVLMTMKQLEEDLPEHLFTRVHKSYIVNIQKVSKIEGNFVFIEKTVIPVGAVYKLILDKKTK
jgi:DNA-binding LytR/AlgR family response regulator